MSYPLESVYEEVAFIGYYLHWRPDTLLGMPHWERRKWCEEVSKINTKVNTEKE